MSDDQVTEKTAEAETAEATSTKLTAEEAQAALADAQKRIKELNKENADRRKKLDAFEAEKSAKDAASMSELEKAKAELDKLTPELETLRKDKQSLLMQSKFDRLVREMKLEFANEKAQEDAYQKLDVETVGEDGAGMKNALTALQKDRPYLFSKLLPPETDATQKGKQSTEITSAEALALKRQSYGAL